MDRVLYILSNALSILLHPIFIPTYGMIMYIATMQFRFTSLPTTYMLLCLGGTFILTSVIPLVLMMLLKKHGQISSFQLSNAKERTTPYIYTLICFGFWCFFLKVSMRLPLVLFVVAIGATIAILLITIVNHWWKISAHLTAMGGLLGGICSIALTYSILPTTLIICTLFISLLLMYARLYVNAHTPLQVVCGYILGLISTFIPTLIIHA